MLNDRSNRVVIRHGRPFAANITSQKEKRLRRYFVTTYQTTTTTAKPRIANTVTTINPAPTPIR